MEVTKKDVDNRKVKRHLVEKRNELIWALSLQDYPNVDIGGVFNLNRSTIKRIMAKKPRDWKPKWQKVQD